MPLAVVDKPSLWSMSEAARLFGLAKVNGRRVVARLVGELGIEPKLMPYNGKGLDRSDLERIAQALNRAIISSPTDHQSAAG